MRQLTSMKRDDYEEQEAHSRANAFLRDLTELSARHGVGIAGDSTLFLMEPEDFQLEYRADAASKVTLS